MVVAVAVVLVVQVTVDEIVDVVAVRDRVVSAARAVDVIGGVAGAWVAGAAAVRVALIDRDHVVVDVVTVRVVQVPVVDEVDVALVDDGGVSAARAVNVLVRAAGLRHALLKVRDQSPTGCRTLNPLLERRADCQRLPACVWPEVSKRSPATYM